MLIMQQMQITAQEFIDQKKFRGILQEFLPMTLRDKSKILYKLNNFNSFKSKNKNFPSRESINYMRCNTIVRNNGKLYTLFFCA